MLRPYTKSFHDLTGGRIEPERTDHISRPRFKVTLWEPGIRSGDLIRWNPNRDVNSLATWTVLAIQPMKGAQGVWKAEIGRVSPDVFVAGERHHIPSHGHLVAMDHCTGAGTVGIGCTLPPGGGGA